MKIGLVQFAGKQDKNANVAHATELIRQAAAEGAEVVCPHELATTIYFPFEEHSRYFSLAETIPGPATQHFGQLARELGIALVLPLFERVEGADYYNSAVMIDSNGDVLGTYRKCTIPHIRRNGRATSAFRYSRR